MELSGSLKDFSVKDIIKFIFSSKKTGTLSISGKVKFYGTIEGKIYFDKGEIINAEAAGKEGESVIYLILMAEEGNFSFSKEIDKKVKRKIEKKTEEILLEGMKRVELLNKLIKKLPSLDTDALFDVNPSSPSSEISLTKEEWYVINLFKGGKKIKDVLMNSSLPDFDTLKAILSLISSGFIKHFEIMEIIPDHSEKAKKILKDYSGIGPPLFPTANAKANRLFYKIDGKKNLLDLSKETELDKEEVLSCFFLLLHKGFVTSNVDSGTLDLIEEQLKKRS